MKYVCLNTIEAMSDDFYLNVFAAVSMYVDADGLNINPAKEWMNGGDGETVVIPCSKEQAEEIIRRFIKEDTVEIEAVGYYHNASDSVSNNRLYKICKEENNKLLS